MRFERVSLEEMLAARDRRVEAQREMLEYLKNQVASENEIDDACLVSFTLNIPGDIKRTPMTRLLFDRGLEELNRIIGNNLSQCDCRIIDKRITDEKTGSEALLSIGQKNNSYEVLKSKEDIAKTIKGFLETVEESFPAARLFDFDVIDISGEKLSRVVPRRCLICDEPAHACARSRAHGLDAVQEKVKELLAEFCADALGEMGREALIMEIHTTPKPGLVDENNNGAHSDMDISLFEKSIDAIAPYLREAAWLGINSGDLSIDELRKQGIIAERNMFLATGGVNTHKGIIYSMGLLLFGMGRTLVTGDNSVEIATSLAKEDADERLAEALIGQESNGSKVYSNYGAKGAVGEAVSGFPMAKLCRDRMLHYLKTIPECHLTLAGTFSLIDVMSIMEDTNLLHRGGMEGLEYVKREAGRISKLLAEADPGDEYTSLTLAIESFDDELIKRNLSPGGSADMLALGYLLIIWEKKVHPIEEEL